MYNVTKNLSSPLFQYSSPLCKHFHFFIPDGEEDGYYFGQEQVPLTDEIKEILEEYPDGQIFKVSYINSM